MDGFCIYTDYHNGFFFNPKTATNRSISTRAGSTLEETDRNVRTAKTEPQILDTFCYFRIYKSFTLCSLEFNIYMHAEKHKPADGKNNPICPTLPLLKHKERQGYGCTAVDSQSWVQFFVRENTL